jgi:hypothetical protein
VQDIRRRSGIGAYGEADLVRDPDLVPRRLVIAAGILVA